MTIGNSVTAEQKILKEISALLTKGIAGQKGKSKPWPSNLSLLYGAAVPVPMFKILGQILASAPEGKFFFN